MKRLFYLYGWLFVRPRRWFFSNMGCANYVVWLPRKEWYGWHLPNVHWYVLRLTVYRFCRWLSWEGWRPFCDWTGGYRRTFPWIARVIKRLGETCVDWHYRECRHCGSGDCDQVTLADDETGTTFILEETWSVGTQDGTDHRFRGTTICPRCGYRATYEDGSL